MEAERNVVIERVSGDIRIGSWFSCREGKFVTPSRGTRFRNEREAMAVVEEFDLKSTEYQISHTRQVRR